jgi:hypothetical protein
MRHPQGPRPRGSQHWLQILVNERPDVFHRAFKRPDLGDIDWKSPLASDDYAEYQDGDFLSLLGIKLPSVPLGGFWPRRGPVWDGLALTSSGEVLLVEAKANIPELKSPPSQAGSKSARLIRAGLARSKPSFGSPAQADWMGSYYQYANRLAHLHLLRAENGIDAQLVFLYFINAEDVNGPSSVEEWKTAIDEAHRVLRIGRGPLTQFTHELFVDVRDLSTA